MKIARAGYLLALALPFALLGCDKPEPAKDPGKSWLDSLEQKNPGAAPELPPDEPEPAETAAPKAPEKPAMPAVEVKPPSGRPAILMGPSASISSTFGATPGASLKLKADGGNFTLKIEEYALNGGYNIDFKIDKGSVKKGPVVGSVVYLRTRAGDKVRADAVATRGKPYEVSVPLNGKDTLNLAVGVVQTDEQGNETGKPEWTIYPPVRVESGFGEAIFQLQAIGPVMYLHGTTAEATAAAPASGG